MSDQETRERIQKIETLIERFEKSTDPYAREDARQLVQALMDLHSIALGRMVTVLIDEGATGQKILNELANDENVSGLLMLYGLHPLSLADRVGNAVKKLQPLLDSHHSTLELISCEEGAVQLRLVVNSNGCHSNSTELKQVIREAIIGAAPDFADLTIEEIAPQPEPVFVPLQGLGKRKVNTSANEGVAVT